MKRATEYMEDRLADDVSLCDLSKLLDLSTFHLCRAFKQSTGLPPYRWRLQRCVERAREMLEGTDLSVTEVAAAVGYDDPSQLAAAFRKALGVSPTQYRRERRT
ncbi:MAG TPA: AraC family transcriptional regulator [Microvirga sp.]|nr:AraC family transcriptional regulator [Microvirga sp.]